MAWVPKPRRLLPMTSARTRPAIPALMANDRATGEVDGHDVGEAVRWRRNQGPTGRCSAAESSLAAPDHVGHGKQQAVTHSPEKTIQVENLTRSAMAPEIRPR